MEPGGADLRQQHRGLAVSWSRGSILEVGRQTLQTSTSTSSTRSMRACYGNAPKGPRRVHAARPLPGLRHQAGQRRTSCSGHMGLRLNEAPSAFRSPAWTVPRASRCPAGAHSVVLNVTAISGTAATALTAYPTGFALPIASDLNVDAAVNQANLVVVALGAGGEVSIYRLAGLDQHRSRCRGGYFAAPGRLLPGVAGLFHPIAPLRICDTRAAAGTVCSGTHSDAPSRPGSVDPGGGVRLPHWRRHLLLRGARQQHRRGSRTQPDRGLGDLFPPSMAVEPPPEPAALVRAGPPRSPTSM